MRVPSTRFTGILLLFALMLSATAIKLVRSAPAAPDPLVQDAERRLKIQELEVQAAAVERNAALRFYGAAFLLAACGLSVLIVAGGLHRAAVKRASVHTYKIGQYNELVVHERDLSLAAPVAMGLMNAEQLKQSNAGLEKAMELYRIMADVQTRQMQGLLKHGSPSRALLPCDFAQGDAGGQGRSGCHAEPFDTAQDKLCRSAVPSFRALLEQGEIARGRPMILGYERGVSYESTPRPSTGSGHRLGGAGGGFIPRRGSFLDIYSAAVAGESGSGKTATLLFLIGSGLVAQHIQFIGIDPHYPHPKSLGFKTKPLWAAGLMTMATYKDDMLTALTAVEQTIDNRLQQIDTDETPVVLVIDELAFLVKTSIGPAITHTMERISTEGRKCAVYMLASSQTWLAARTGNNTVVRDTLTSAYVHRIKPKQANLLLQDKDEAEKVKKQVKHAGEALLVPVGDESVVVRMPFTTDADMQLVVTQVTQVTQVEEGECNTPGDSLRSTTGELLQPKPRVLSEANPRVLTHRESLSPIANQQSTIQSLDLATEYGLRTCAKTLRDAGTISYGEIARETGISKSTAHAWVNDPQKTLRPEQKDALRHYLERLEQTAAMPV